MGGLDGNPGAAVHSLKLAHLAPGLSAAAASRLVRNRGCFFVAQQIELQLNPAAFCLRVPDGRSRYQKSLQRKD
jgi:hypothetical protein